MITNKFLAVTIGLVFLITFCFFKIAQATYWPENHRYFSQTLWFVAGQFAVLLYALIVDWTNPNDDMYILLNAFGLFLEFLVCFLYFFYLGLIRGIIKTDYSLNYRIPFEFMLFISISVFGLLCLINLCNSFIYVYVCLEVVSLCSIIISFNLKGGIRGSLIYYVLSAIGSGCLLYGISYIYYVAGCVDFKNLSIFFEHMVKALSPEKLIELKFGYILFVCGLFIKLGTLAPFHLWLGEVYNAANTYIVAYFASIPVLGLFGILLKLNAYIGFGFILSLGVFFKIISVVSVIIGTFGAMRQDRLKRIFAYSSISNMGYLVSLVPYVDADSYTAMLIYLSLYCISSFCFWGVLVLIEYVCKIEVNTVHDLAVLHKSRKIISVSLLIFFFSSIGIPPLAGFFGKYHLFLSLFAHESYIILVFFIIMSCFSAFYFLRAIITIIMSIPKDQKIYFARNIGRYGLQYFLVIFTIFHIIFFLYAYMHVLHCTIAGKSLFIIWHKIL